MELKNCVTFLSIKHDQNSESFLINIVVLYITEDFFQYDSIIQLSIQTKFTLYSSTIKEKIESGADLKLDSTPVTWQ